MILVKTDGEIVLARPNRDGYVPLSSHQLTSETLRALPALSNGMLFVRDDNTLYCLDVGRN